MSEINWDEKIDYLKQSRLKLWNDDYFYFLVNFVWKINKPVDVIDFGCGLGYLAGLLMPVLPKGSTYTGIDKGTKLIQEAQEIFKENPYNITFVEQDFFQMNNDKKYDISICQLVLVNLQNPKDLLKVMINSTKTDGLVVCIELDRSSSNGSMYVDGIEVNDFNHLGILQKTTYLEYKKNKTDKNVGIKIPVYLQELNLKNVAVRVNDYVQFINPHSDEYKRELKGFLSNGWGYEPREKAIEIDALCKNGLTKEEAEHLFICQEKLNDYIRKNIDCLFAVHAPVFYISFGWV